MIWDEWINNWNWIELWLWWLLLVSGECETLILMRVCEYTEGSACIVIVMYGWMVLVVVWVCESCVVVVSECEIVKDPDSRIRINAGQNFQVETKDKRILEKFRPGIRNIIYFNIDTEWGADVLNWRIIWF